MSFDAAPTSTIIISVIEKVRHFKNVDGLEYASIIRFDYYELQERRFRIA